MVRYQLESYVPMLLNQLPKWLKRLAGVVDDVELLLGFHCCHPLCPLQVRIVDYQELQRLLRLVHIPDFLCILIEPEVNFLLEMLANTVLEEN